MKIQIRRWITVWLLSGLSLSAQEATDTKAVQENASLMQEALTLRATLAAEISSETVTAPAALERLQEASFPSGLRISSDAGFAYAAIDIGQRLMVLNNRPEAALFFDAAETALKRQVQQTPDVQARDKAQYLQKLALIQGNYLNKPVEAKTAVDAAITLQPEDRRLKLFRTVINSDKADYFKAKSGQGEDKK